MSPLNFCNFDYGSDKLDYEIGSYKSSKGEVLQQNSQPLSLLFSNLVSWTINNFWVF